MAWRFKKLLCFALVLVRSLAITFGISSWKLAAYCIRGKMFAGRVAYLKWHIRSRSYQPCSIDVELCYSSCNDMIQKRFQIFCNYPRLFRFQAYVCILILYSYTIRCQRKLVSILKPFAVELTFRLHFRCDMFSNAFENL